MTFGLAASLVWGVRSADRGDAARRRRRAAHAAFLALLGVAAGYAVQPAFVTLVVLLGQLLGLTPGSAPAPPCRGAVALLGSVALAPLFEEPLYRERLLAALRSRVGAPAAIGLSSAAFAVPHVHAWPMLATFLAGISLGAVAQRTGSLALCIGLHAGLNLASAWEGVPATSRLLAPGWRIALGGVACAAIVGLTRRCP